MTEWLIWLLVVAATIVGMEGIASLVHRHVMHGFGWSWHRSHHEPHDAFFEKNDLYALVFSAIGILLFVAADRLPILKAGGVGMTTYGLLYALLHDGLVHRRLPLMKAPRSGYMKRLVQAHRLHHATRGREGAVSFGFLYAPPVAGLIAQMRAMRDRS